MPFRTVRTNKGFKQVYIPDPEEKYIEQCKEKASIDAAHEHIAEVPPKLSDKEFYNAMRELSPANLHGFISYDPSMEKPNFIPEKEFTDSMSESVEDKIVHIYLASHKDYVFPDIDIYKPLQVGAALHEDLHFPYRDDTGDNISEKNPYYCEMTAYYWVWKNSTADIVGVGHYRRVPANPAEELYSKEEVIDILSHNDYMTTGCVEWRESEVNYYKLDKDEDTDIPGYGVYNQYRRCHNGVDMDLAWLAIKRLYPEYEEDFVNQIVFGRLFVPCNILIAPKPIFDGFCKWIFDILFFVEKYSPYKLYDDYNQRVFGFLAERLLALYFFHNKLKCQNCAVIDLNKEEEDE